MQTEIFYFSGTGNSLKVARDLTEEIPQSSITSIPKVIKQEEIICTGIMGIVFPVYMFGIPLIVSRFIKRIKAEPGTYIFAVATLGGTAGPALAQAAGELRRRGLKLSAGFLVPMPGNYTPLYEAAGHQKQEKLFSGEKLKVKEIAGMVNERREHFDKSPALLNSLLGLVYKFGAPKIPYLDKDFRSTDNCDGCGICAKVCPADNIVLKSSRPRWLHRCEQCFACFHWCPKQAIEYGKSTVGRRRYRHPEVRASDIADGK